MGIQQDDLVSWYLINKRELPWRDTKDPYSIWLSEVLLQQTRVQQGLPYYNRFLKAYPTVLSLSLACEDDVLNLWQGLGYYSRARNMLQTAKFIVDNLDGNFPENYLSLLKLKGIGEYTASAIASFSFDEPVAVVDGNVYRVLSRIFDINTPIDSAEGKNVFKVLANDFLDKQRPAIFNQAIMEFGALQCTPKKPNCFLCVFEKKCLSKVNNTVNERPIKLKKTKTRQRYFVFLVFCLNNETYVQKRKAKDIWQGLYEFPLVEFESSEDQNAFLQQHRSKAIFQSTEITHILSHQKITAFFICFDSIIKLVMPKSNLIKIPINNLVDYPVSVLTENFLKKTNDLSFLSKANNVN